MKITKQGTIPVVKEEVWIGKCDYCKSEYEAKSSELNSEYGRSIIPDTFAVCELCNRRVYFKKLVTREQHDSLWKVVPGSELAI